MTPIAAHPVLTCAEAKEWEAGLLKKPSAEWAAMQSAGAAVAKEIEQDFLEIGGLPRDSRVLVLAGKGHNAGDALLAAANLATKYSGVRVDVCFCFAEKFLKPLAKRSWQLLRKNGKRRVRVVDVKAVKATSYAVCLDGVFGFQFRPPMDASIRTLFEGVNAHPRIRLRAAVDLPSGVTEGNSTCALRADFTYATGIVKSPVLREENAETVGRLRYLDLGFFTESAPAAKLRVLRPEMLRPLANLRRARTDKRTFGHVFIVGGSLSYPGAVMLAVRAALRSGAGLVTAFVPESLVAQYAAAHPEAMWVACPVGKSGGLNAKCLALVRKKIARSDALLIGPGCGAAPETMVMAAKLAEESPVPVVLDADALRPQVVGKLRKKTFVCTPHAGEYARIQDVLNQTPSGTVVLKGPITRVLVPHEAKLLPREEYVSLHGGPVLARGGSGDILAGLTAGLLAQTPDDPGAAACRAVVWHGLAADLLARVHGQVAIETSQLLEQLGPALVHAAFGEDAQA